MTTTSMPIHSQTDRLRAVRLQLMWNRLLAVVEEQAQSLIRTAFSSMVRECGDISVGIFDLQGRMLAQAVTGTPGHVNTMAESVSHFLRHFPVEQMHEGDAYVTNDPWLGTGHLNDFVLTAPVFRAKRPVALVACTSHIIDIGGIGFGPDGSDVFMEGLSIPLLKAVDRGRINETLMEIVKANSRLPIDAEGDVHSLLACCETGIARLNEMMDQFSFDSLTELGDHIVERSRQAVIEEIAALPQGTYFSELVSDGYDEPVILRARLTIAADGCAVDFTGTSGVSRRGINVPLTYTKAYGTFALACVISPGVPNNAGSLQPYRVFAPAGCVLNAPRPHAVAARHVIGQLLPDTLFGCLRQAVPDRVPAEGTACLWNLILRSLPDSRSRFMMMAATNGGTGGRPGLDGLSATAFPSGVKGTPVEILESIAPVIIWKKQLRAGSAGLGEYRGGLGQEIEVAHLGGEPMELLAAFDRIIHPARGAEGGASGAPGYVGLASGAVLAGKGTQLIPAGDRLILRTPGGGGWGTPDAREATLLASDRGNGLLA